MEGLALKASSSCFTCSGGLAAPLVAVGATAALGATAGAALATGGGVIAIGVLFGSGGAGLMVSLCVAKQN